MTLMDAHSRILVLDEHFPGRLVTETLFASDEAAAIERILDDVADVAGDTVADRVLAPLRQVLSKAIVTGSERAWCDVYDILAAVIAKRSIDGTPAFGRLTAFLRENSDLAQDVDRGE